jgi:hypothetical protein
MARVVVVSGGGTGMGQAIAAVSPPPATAW